MPKLSTWQLVGSMLAAAVLGGVIGFEREISGQPAGFRTHILVALGAALFTSVGAYGVEGLVDDPSTRFDPTRVAAQVVVGIGFLGAGAILQQGLTVRGLTTAAALWVTAAVGTAVALGFWPAALAVTITTVLALYGLKPVEDRVFRRLRRGQHRLVIEIAPALRLSDLAKVIEDSNASAESFDLVTDDDDRHHVIVTVRLASSTPLDLVTQRIGLVDGVRSVSTE
jgi:putative Mg2+ transporter-C (MgtC) family protein